MVKERRQSRETTHDRAVHAPIREKPCGAAARGVRDTRCGVVVPGCAAVCARFYSFEMCSERTLTFCLHWNTHTTRRCAAAG